MAPTVVALGGNTLIRSGEGTVAEERRRIRETREQLDALADRDGALVFTHGNGPQVGYRLLAEEQSEEPPEPLDVLVAETQARVGYHLQQGFEGALGSRPVAVVTRTLVDPDDPRFEEPSKPVGPHYTKTEAEQKSFETREVHTGEGGTAYRRVVPSPRPVEVLEIDRIRRLVADAGPEDGPVICGGGGGVPVVPRETVEGRNQTDEPYEGVAAVIDKDTTTRLIAEAVDADLLVMLTDVDAVYEDYGTPEQEPIERATPTDLRERLDADEFEAGTMRPKVDACATFVAETAGEALVTSPERLGDALAHEAGTWVVPADESGAGAV